MAKPIDFKALKEAIEVAEARIQELNDISSHSAKKNIKKINRALEKAYEVLNKSISDQKIIDKRVDEVWLSLIDDRKPFAIWIFLIGILLSGSLIFAGDQIYKTLNKFVINEGDNNWATRPIDSRLVDVEYVEDKVVSLYDQMSVSDQEGWKNPKQEFTIRNNGTRAGKGVYSVNYKVKIVPLNKKDTKLIDPQYIKYRYRYYDSAKKKYSEYKMGNLKDLTDENGEMILNNTVEPRDAHHDYEVTFWISSHATNENMGASYTFAFQVDAVVLGS